MQQIRDAPLVMHQDHSESLGLHVAQRINCYKLPRKLPQIRSAQHEGMMWFDIKDRKVEGFGCSESIIYVEGIRRL